jgi:tetratricopeptide (TPR) repeat protein
MAQCRGKNKDGTPCKNLVPKGKKYCHHHGRRRFWKNLSVSAIVSIILVVIGLIADLFGISGFNLRQVLFQEKMTGDFRIAVAGFAEKGVNMQSHLGYELADSVKLHLNENLTEIKPGLIITVWGPDRVGVIYGDTAEARAVEAERIAQRIHADMIVYGLIETNGQGEYTVTPEFYISAENYYEASEITGEHDLGTSFQIVSSSNPALRYEFGEQMYTRSKALSIISVGLAYFAIHDYQKALDIFRSAENIDGWQDRQGKQVLYAMIGYAAGKAAKYDLANTALNKAIEIDPNYTRPYIGMANLAYIQALAPFDKSKDPKDIDLKSLEDCFRYLNMAEQAPKKPPLADIETKIHFSRGQCYWLKTYSAQLPTFDLAVSEFDKVITAYDDGSNPRIQELAGESYARLGLIYDLSGYKELAGHQYQTAAELLKDIPGRYELYKKRANELLNITPVP